MINKIQTIHINVYIQAGCDIVIITFLVHITGGIKSFHSLLYPLVIIYSELFLGKKGGIIIATASGAFYSLLICLEHFGIIPSSTVIFSSYLFGLEYLLLRITINILSFYIVAILFGFAVEQESQTRMLLAEKESQFHQLDLLHKSIIESVNTGIITIDLKKQIKSFNRAAEKITGFSFDMIKNKSLDYIFPGFSEIITKQNQHCPGNEDISILSPKSQNEISIAVKPNESSILGFSTSALINSSNDVIGTIIIFQDLTLQKKMEKEIGKSKRLALIGEMAAGLAHEIRNPLASLSGSIQILKKNLDQNEYLNSTDSKLMHIILRGRNQIENLVKNFLLLARPNPACRDIICINTIIDDIIESMRNSPDWHKNIKVEKKICIIANIYGNMTEITQMLSNLFINALQSMPDGGELLIETKQIVNSGKLDLNILKPCENCLEIIIKDTGCGINQDEMKNIFKPFYTTKDKGIGLGLAIVNRIVESHCGKITINSKRNKGTIFNILFPARKIKQPSYNQINTDTDLSISENPGKVLLLAQKDKKPVPI